MVNCAASVWVSNEQAVSCVYPMAGIDPLCVLTPCCSCLLGQERGLKISNWPSIENCLLHSHLF